MVFYGISYSMSNTIALLNHDSCCSPRRCFAYQLFIKSLGRVSLAGTGFLIDGDGFGGDTRVTFATFATLGAAPNRRVFSFFLCGTSEKLAPNAI